MPSFRPLSTARSIGSWSSDLEARQAYRITSSGLTPDTVKGSPRDSLFWVKVPVLSEQSMSMPAISSILASLVTIAFLRAKSLAPTAIVTESTVGMATGTAATVNTRANSRVLIISSPLKRATPSIRATKNIAITIR